MNLKLAAATIVGLVGATAPAHAAITVYNAAAAFNNATTAVATDTFDNVNLTGVTPSPITRAVGSYGYTAAATGGFYGAGTTADRWLSTNVATDAITFTGFTGGVSALGGFFFGSDINGAFQSAVNGIVVTITDADGTVTRTIANPTTTNFLGFTSTTGITSFTVSAVQPAGGTLWPTVNNLSLGRLAATPAVPEPATWAMMLVGFAMVGAVTRYRRKSTAVRYA